MDATVTWRQRMTFTGTADTGFQVPLGTDPKVGGDNDGFQPIELMAVSLAGCTAMDVISIMRKKQQVITGFDVKVHTDRAQEHPHVFTHAVITYHVMGHDLDENALRRAVELSATKYCPAQAMLSKVFPIELEFAIYEGETTADRQLVKSGVFNF